MVRINPHQGMPAMKNPQPHCLELNLAVLLLCLALILQALPAHSAEPSPGSLHLPAWVVILGLALGSRRIRPTICSIAVADFVSLRLQST